MLHAGAPNRKQIARQFVFWEEGGSKTTALKAEEGGEKPTGEGNRIFPLEKSYIFARNESLAEKCFFLPTTVRHLFALSEK